MINIAILGSTGSIGRQVLNVVRRYPDKYRVVGIACGGSAKMLGEQIAEFKPTAAAIANPENLKDIGKIDGGTSLYYGAKAATHIAGMKEADIVFAAITGYSGVKPVIEAVGSGKTVALANKESLVAAGEIIMPLAKKTGAKIIPVDSEHSAIWQCLNFNADKEFKKLIITASGGALRDVPISDLEAVTACDALKHPNWQMGAKITIDCATMANKGFEVIEAMRLFNAPLDKIDVLIHPESIVHSMVEFSDGAILAQMGIPSMETPIQLALTYPERFPTLLKPLDLRNKTLSFKEVDLNRYPCFKLVLDAAEKGGVFPCAVSAADEAAVKLYLDGKIKYTEIYDYAAYALDKTKSVPVTIDNLDYVDARSRGLVARRFAETGDNK